MLYDRAPTVETRLPGVRQASGSGQALLRHMEEIAYRCFLPDLTGFTTFHCAGPGLQHRWQGHWPRRPAPKVGIDAPL